MKKTKHLILITAAIALLHNSNAQGTWSLKACIDTAINRNITIKQGQLNSSIGKVNWLQAKENLWPNLNITDAPAFNFGKTQNLTTGQYIGENTTTNSLGITGSVTLYNGEQYQNTIKENKYTYDASVQETEKLKNDITLTVLGDYLSVISAQEQVNVANTQLATDTLNLIETKKWVDAGRYPILNLLQIQSQKAADNYTKVTAVTQLQIANVNLMQAMNMPVVSNFAVTTPAVADSILSITALVSADIDKIAESFLPEVKNAQLTASANQEAIEIAKSLYLPKLTLSGSIRTSGNSLVYNESVQQGFIGYVQNNPTEDVIGYNEIASSSNNFTNLLNQLNNNFNQVIGLNLSIPIFNNYVARNTIEIAKLNYQIAALNQDEVSITIRQNIEQAYTQLMAAAAQFNASKEALATEIVTYNNIEKKFQIGLSNATDLLIEKSNYLKAEQNLVETKYTYLFKMKLIDFYLGKPITL